MVPTPHPMLNRSTIDALYGEALLLADEARAWFDRARGSEESRGRLSPLAVNITDDPLYHWAGRDDPSLRVTLSCESLRLTTRLMHIIAWLMLQRAVGAGEVAPEAIYQEHNRLGESPESDPELRRRLPEQARRLIEASLRLHERVAHLEDGLLNRTARGNPVHAMHQRLNAII